MEFKIPSLVTYVAAWFGIMGGIWALFDRAEIVLHEDVRKRLSNWLQNNTTHPDMQSWPEIFGDIFDRVFGKKHFSLKCFNRSCLASISAIFIMILVVSAININIVRDELYDLHTIIIYIIAAIVTNLIPDYLSLIETRFVLKYMKGLSMFGCFIAILIDFVITALIISFAFSLLFIIYNYFYETLNLPEIIDESGRVLLEGTLFWQAKTGALAGIFIYSTFATSIWIWMFFLSSLIIKGVSSTGMSIQWVANFFDIDNKPLRTLGFICMLISTIAFILIPFII